jgi:hypothetical protein
MESEYRVEMNNDSIFMFVITMGVLIPCTFLAISLWIKYRNLNCKKLMIYLYINVMLDTGRRN